MFQKMKNRKAISILVLLLMIGAGLAYWKIAYGVTRTWDGGGTDGTCGGAGTANNWSCAANWSGDTAPTASDIATFDGTSTKNATINANISVAGIDINTGYTGTITQSGSYTVTVGTSHYNQADGIFAGGSGTIDINGTFTLSNGTFTSTSGTLEVGRAVSTDETIFALSGGTFNHNDGTINFAPDSTDYYGKTYTVDVLTSITLYNVIVTAVRGQETSSILTLASGDAIIVANNFTHADGLLVGAWEVQGNVVIGAGADGGETLTMTGAGAKTYAYSAGGLGPYLRINNASAVVTPAGGTTSLNLSRFSILSGTFTAPTGVFSVGRAYAADETIFALSGGTFNHNDGTINFAPDSTDYYGKTYTVDVLTSITLYNVIVTAVRGQGGTSSILTLASGDTAIVANNFTHTDGALAGTWQVQGNAIIATTADGGSATLAFTGGNDQTYTDQGGNEPDGDITINKTAGTVTLASNADWNAASQDLTITQGQLRVAGTSALSTTALTVGSAGVLKMTGTGDLTLAGNVSNSGQIVVQSNQTCGGTDDIQILSSSNGVQRSWSGTGTYTIYDATVKDQGGSAAITAYSSTSVSGNGVNWTFSGAACPDIPPAMSIGSGFFRIGSGRMNLR